MKKGNVRALIIAAAVLLAFGVGLYFVNPWGPLLLLLTLAIQLPIIYAITKSTMNSSYRDRAFERRQQFAEDGDADAWLAGEEKEAASVGYKYWSPAARAQNVLARAEALAELDRSSDAANLLAELDEKKLPSHDRTRFDAVVERIRME
ncbi:hypothetical protein LJC60_08250 [Ruminococcaceae bacterium OttesenSCG-928-D13]|nr:hypothetical protein [Ruminococcaceae bacterium OttesenSCG-928-D13]